MVRRLRAAHGGRLGTPRPRILRDPRRPVARIPPAGHASLRRIAGTRDHVRNSHARVQSGRSLGGERVLDRPVLEDRSRRLARHQTLVRESIAAQSAHQRRRVLRIDLRHRGSGAGRRCKQRWARRRSSSCATEALTPFEAMRTATMNAQCRHRRSRAPCWAMMRCTGRIEALPRRRRPCLRLGDGSVAVAGRGCCAAGLPDAVAQAGAVLDHACGLGLAGARDARVDTKSCPLAAAGPSGQ